MSGSLRTALDLSITEPRSPLVRVEKREIEGWSPSLACRMLSLEAAVGGDAGQGMVGRVDGGGC